MASVNINEKERCSIGWSVNTEPQSLLHGHQECIKQEEDSDFLEKKGENILCDPIRSPGSVAHPLYQRESIKRRKPPAPTQKLAPSDYSPEPAKKRPVLCKTPVHDGEQPTTSNPAGRTSRASRIERECSVHKKIMELYCTTDSTYMCTTCLLDHVSHKVLPLDQHAEERKKSLQKMCETLKQKKEQNGHKITDKLAVLYEVERQTSHIIQESEALQMKVFREIRDNIQQLEDNNEAIVRMINRIDVLCNENNLLTFLNTESQMMDEFEGSCRTHTEIDETQILRQDILKLADDLIKRMLDEPPKIKSKITLDASTAHKDLDISNTGTEVEYHKINRDTRSICNQFMSHHVLSIETFSSGVHYWEVNVTGKRCSIGVAYQSMDRETRRHTARIGHNKKSWSLDMHDLSVWHNDVQQKTHTDPSVTSFGVFLDCETGRLSFYQLCDPIRRLHTFTTTFTEPLHAAFYLYEGSRITILQ